MKPKRSMITEKIGELDFWSDLCGSFDEVIKSLKSCKDFYHSKHPLQKDEEIYIDYTSYYDEGSLDVYLKRYENDKEYNKRIKKEKTLQTSIKNKELTEYKRLKKKYG